MRAALFNGSEKLEIEEVEIGDPAPGQVRVRVHHCSICHSDLKAMAGGAGMTPAILGHEAAGVVDKVGDGVEMVAPGDKVVLSPIATCGKCYWCVRAQFGQCVNKGQTLMSTFLDGTTGISRGDEKVYRGMGVGGFAEYALVSETAAVKIPADTPLDVACVIGCAVQTGAGAVLNAAHVEPGASVVVIGLGGIGLSCVQGAHVAGASRIIGSDPIAGRREMALRVGATDVIDPTEVDVVATVGELTGGIGADYGFEASGVAALQNVAIDATRAGGLTVLVGVPELEDALTIPNVMFWALQEKRLMGTLMGSTNSLRDIPMFIALWRSGQLDLETLITARRPLDDINAGFDDLAAGVGVRTVIDLI